MGWGDHIMATADARDEFARHGQKMIVGPNAEWSDLFDGNPYLLKKPAPGCRVLNNYTGNRPYIREVRDRRVIFSDYRVRPGDIYLKFNETFWAKKHVPEKFVIVEPNTKGTVYADNKSWGHEKYQKVVSALPLTWVQIGPKKTLKGVRFVQTESFRQACAVMSLAHAFLGGEGGLHHAAAALGIPAVVIFGGHSSPAVTGYPGHVNLAYGEPCGAMTSCPHCRDAMNKITVEQVVEAVRGVCAEDR